MRLLHTERLEFEEYFESQTPKYAILSHRWTSDEVSFEHFHLHKKEQKQNFAKIQNYCDLAKKDGYEWVWIDTCCIDKRSSTELTEAINSMYAWYKKAAICHAYLADVLIIEGEDGWSYTNQQFHDSAWFTKGWTLQELLAPQIVLFLDVNWGVMGSKDLTHGPREQRALEHEVSEIAGINLEDLRDPTSQCVARKLSWLSKRKTTRIEDIAYCMLGLCGVNMPLLYGEGAKAFRRLQEEIIRTSADESIFAWFCNENKDSVLTACGIMATGPMDFAKSGRVRVAEKSVRLLEGKLPYSMTNMGLGYQIPKSFVSGAKEPETGNVFCSLPLQCTIDSLPGIEELDHHSPFGRTAVTIDFVYNEGGCGRLIRDSRRYILSAPQSWNEAVEDVKCAFETIYFLEFEPSYCDSELDLGSWLDLLAPQRKVLTDATGEVYEIREKFAGKDNKGRGKHQL
ncbi:MAG: hypothetical protein Q9169_006853 [Polycauliona sp. 2 TL-2023]